MTLKIDTIFEQDVLAKLETITALNGFTNEVSVLDGYLIHYVDDLMSEEEPVSFPCVGVQPESDEGVSNSGSTKSKNERVYLLIGAIDGTDYKTVNRRLNSLLNDVRKVLSFNKFFNSSLATSFDLGSATFSLPKSENNYAYFEMKLTVNYIEELK